MLDSSISFNSVLIHGTPLSSKEERLETLKSTIDYLRQEVKAWQKEYQKTQEKYGLRREKLEQETEIRIQQITSQKETEKQIVCFPISFFFPLCFTPFHLTQSNFYS